MTYGAAPGGFPASDPWHDALPAAWPTARLGHLVEVITGRTPDRAAPEYWQDGTIPWISLTDLKSEVISGSSERVTELAVAEEATRLVPAGCVLLAAHGTARSLPVAVAANEIAIGQDIRGLVCGLRIRPDFLQAVLVSQAERLIAQEASLAPGRRRLTVETLRRLDVPCPPREVQDEVMTRLRASTATLDALVRVKEREVQLLAERRDAVIASTVVGRLWPGPPDLQAARIPYSIMPWLEAIPGHWEVRRLGDLGQLATGATPSRGDDRYWTDGTMPWLTSSVVNDGKVTSAEERVTAAALQRYHLPLLQPGAVLIATAGQGRTRGQAAVLSLAATINQNLISIQPNPAILDSWFLRWVLFAAYDFLRGISEDGGGSRGVLTRTQVATLRVPVPPLAEQRSIAAHIARETVRIDGLTDAAERTIGYLGERRTALLSAAITGHTDKMGLNDCH